MSASLVGSEMCIRDRCNHRPSRVTFRDRSGRLVTQLRRQAPLIGADSRAVSYTHLTLPTICSV
eukprot:11273768-Alexandrium_andersonii.AAC.1